MRISSFLRLALECFIVASIIVLIIGVIYFVWYFIQKKRKKNVTINKKKLILLALLIGYLVVVFIATLGQRGSFWAYDNMRISFQPFVSYIEAWNQFDMSAWRNIVLNICMMIPLGFLLPFYHRVFQKWWVTYLSGFVLTLLIEIIQLVSHRGIFEIDDIINNTLGCMIGFGIWALGYFIYQKLKKQDRKILPVLFQQIPIVLTIMTFLSIFIIYEQKELGNLKENYVQTVDMSNIKLENKSKLSSLPLKQPVYKTKVYTEDECYQLAKSYFDKESMEIDSTMTDQYDNLIVYYSQNREASIWVEYRGGIIRYSHYQLENEELNYKKGLSFQEVSQLLNEYDIKIPEEATMKELENGEYLFELQDIIEGDCYILGSIRCQVSKDLKLISIDNRVKRYQLYKEYDIMTIEEAYQRVKEGKFNERYLNDVQDEIVIVSSQLSYIEDTKGFLQPVYKFITKDNGVIYIPAIVS